MKDYRIQAPVDIGRVYREANENPENSNKEAPASKDPDSVGRGLAVSIVTKG